MREILFRGKRVDNGEWVYGFYQNIQEKEYYILTNCNIGLLHYVVIPETVGQFTGLFDKNGDRIFEGDILHIPDYSKGLAVTYEQPKKKIVVEYKNGWELTSGTWFNNRLVIGNIHDNE